MTILNIELKILDKRIGKDIPIPKYATVGSAGIDLYACIDNELIIKANFTELIPTGIAIYIKDKNYMGMIVPRSGLGHKNGIVLGNLVGIIDSDYQGQILISCWNRSKDDFMVKPNERIAQLIIVPIAQANFVLVNDFATTDRGSGGFGHTG